MNKLNKFKLKQLDTILWSPNPIPPAYEKEGFGIIPKPSVLGIIEIKNSKYQGSIDKIIENIENTKHLFSKKSLNKNSIGVIPFLSKAEQRSEKKKLEKYKDRIMILSKQLDNGNSKIREEDFVRFLNYLNNVNKVSCDPKFYSQIII